MNNLHMQSSQARQAGFSLMEVLIAMLILSIGLLGLAALQATSLKANHSAYQRTQATFLAYDMMDRMRSNRTQAANGDYNITLAENAPSSSTLLAEVDLEEWINDYISVLLPAGDGSVNCDAAAVCTVVVQWDESRIGGSATSGGSTSTFSFTAEL